jgi:hypothetical protein
MVRRRDYYVAPTGLAIFVRTLTHSFRCGLLIFRQLRWLFAVFLCVFAPWREKQSLAKAQRRQEYLMLESTSQRWP